MRFFQQKFRNIFTINQLQIDTHREFFRNLVKLNGKLCIQSDSDLI